MAKPQKKIKPPSKTAFGLYSKREGAKLIAQGTRHVHSSRLGVRDQLVKSTQQSLETSKVPTYPWEKGSDAETIQIKASQDRFEVIKKILSHPSLSNKRDLKEKVHTVLEELLTNAIFHSYNNADGTPKYGRLATVSLEKTEWIQLDVSVQDSGIFIKIKDCGGNHRFEDISQALARCYLQTDAQIQTKEGGAGLGLYMIFDAVTHWKILSHPSQHTTISLWISDKKHYEADTFTFNFFEEE